MGDGGHADGTTLRPHRQPHKQPNLQGKGGSKMSSPEDQTPTSEYDFTMTGKGGVYYFTWENLLVDVEVSNCRPGRDDSITAYLKVSTRRPNGGYITHGNLNLDSIIGRRNYATECTKRDAELDWDAILSLLAMNVRDSEQRGVPEERITGEQLERVTEDVRWLVEPIIQVGQPTLVYGKGSSGKSYFSQFVSVLVNEGISANGLTVEQATTLYLDWETDGDEITRRVARIRKGMELSKLTSAGLIYKRMNKGLAADIGTVMELVNKYSVHFVILDSLGSACMGEPESADVVLRMFAALRSLGVTSLCVDHVNKDNHLFGSVYKFNASRLIFEVIKAQRAGEDKLEFALYHRKANNAKIIKPMGFELAFDNANLTAVLKRVDIKDTDLEQDMHVVDRIRNLLVNGAMSTQKLGLELDRTSTHISKEISLANKRAGENNRPDVFIKLSDGKYGLASREDDTWLT